MRRLLLRHKQRLKLVAMDLVADEFRMFAILVFHINIDLKIAGTATYCRSGLFVVYLVLKHRGRVCRTRGSIGQRELLAHDY